MEDTLVSGFCTYCGRQIINDRAVVGSISVRMDRTSELVNILKLAKYAMYDGDRNGAQVLVSKAMQMDSNNSDVWYMDAVLDRGNSKNDMQRARQYPSLGIFKESEVAAYRNFDTSANQGLLIASIVIAFMATFISIPIGAVFEMYLLIPATLVAGLVLVAAAYVHLKRNKRDIPAPLFDDEGRAVTEAARETAMKNSPKE